MFINSIRDVLQILGYDIEKNLLIKDKTDVIESSSFKSTNITASATAITTIQIDNNITNIQKQRKQLVLKGIDIVLSLFAAVGQQRLFLGCITNYRAGWKEK